MKSKNFTPIPKANEIQAEMVEGEIEEIVLLEVAEDASIATSSYRPHPSRRRSMQTLNSTIPMAKKLSGDARILVPQPSIVPESQNSETYTLIREKGFIETSKDEKSTISVDVDTASYSNVRRFLQNGEVPVKDAIRLEEIVNYFHYQYPQPKGENPFSPSQLDWNQHHGMRKPKSYM